MLTFHSQNNQSKKKTQWTHGNSHCSPKIVFIFFKIFICCMYLALNDFTQYYGKGPRGLTTIQMGSSINAKGSSPAGKSD